LGGEHLIDDCSDFNDDVSDSDSDKEDDQTLDEIYEIVAQGEIDLNKIMVSAAHAGKLKGVDPAHLSKTWKIDLQTAQRTLKVVSQNNKRTDDPTLSRNYGANKRMLWHKRIGEHVFMVTFFATKKAGKSSLGHS
jgi:hypothetical protein